ncbi:2-succinyl-5-enolpyruvyl-6-hydroxy-3-cyclohexene-1-carboxylic-acid synthase [Bernardetia sp. MNP-M8]|uniref:2-succinyl-5-enolpyruvyl-6-hydroxy-3- cyclohexene-1-carboxylic-acid synthase n=1 Tax=Bernardetia sp. MNP-M8 TaxID=3127470 RepID=UPI0030CEEE77
MSYALQPIWNIAHICHRHGIENVIISPGSRSAPLTLAFVRHKNLNCKVVADERSAAFIALGIAQQTNKPVVLICTSGSAAYNYAPAIAEAYFQQIPLLVLTADRPPEWIDQFDGQTIRQTNIYGKHVKESYTLPVDLSHEDAVWHIERTISEAINLCQTYPAAPVHINAPFREPFYPPIEVTNEEDDINSLYENQIKYDNDVKIIEQIHSRPKIRTQHWEQLLEVWNRTEKKLIVGGQMRYDERLIYALNGLEVTVVADVISNLHIVKNSIQHQDVFLMNRESLEELRPELLITFGKSVISKNLKKFLREYPAIEHWHIQPAGIAADTFQSLTKVIPLNPSYFFRKVLEKQTRFAESYRQSFFVDNWRGTDAEIKKLNAHFFEEQPFSEFEAVKRLMEHLPQRSNFHLANSMSVRYANYLNLDKDANKEIEIFSNRGTSGIDGSTSTAIGHALADDETLNILLTGDVAFFYDRNAFWNNYLPKNLIVILLNNHGGGIFKMLPDAAKQPESDEFFVIKQPLNAQSLSKEFELEYTFCEDKSKIEFQEALEKLELDVEKRSRISIVEVKTSIEINTKVFQDYKKAVKFLEVD